MEIVREDGIPDFSRLLSLIKIAWPVELGDHSDEVILSEMEKSYNKDTDVIKYLVENGERIGWYRYTRMKDDDGSFFAHTLDIGILPERQGMGLGRLLMNDMIDSSRKAGFKKLMSRTMESNAQSIGFHKATGFSEAFRKGTSIVWELSL